MLSRIGVSVLIAAALLCTAAAVEADTAPVGSQQASLVKVVVKSPKAVVHRLVHFRPAAHPRSSYVFKVIVPYEAKRWGANVGTISRRIRCESGGNWWASNGAYNGVGQFSASTFWRGLSTIRSLRVRLVTARMRWIHTRVYHYWSNGQVSRERGRVMHQRVIQTRVGRISRAYSDAWTQTRIMSQAAAGISAVHDSEWECRG
jgi:hypothetical protein